MGGIAPRPELAEAQVNRLDEWNEVLKGRKSDRFAQLLGSLGEPRIAAGEAQVLPIGDSEIRAELRELAKEKAAEYRSELEELTTRLERELASVDPMTVLLLVAFLNTAHLRGTYWEPTSSQSETEVELIAGLLASLPPPEDDLTPLTFEAAYGILQLSREIHIVSVLQTNAAGYERDENPEGELAYQARLRHLMVRGTTYMHHGRELALALFEPFSQKLRDRYGFDFSDVLNVEAAVVSLGTPRAEALVMRAIDVGESAAARYEGDEDRANAVRRAAAMEVLIGGVGEALSFSTDEFERFGVPRARVEAIIRGLSFPLRENYLDRRFAHQRNTFRERPFVRWGRHIALPLPGILQRESYVLLQPLMFTLLNEWEKRRAAILDSLAVDHLATSLPGADIHRNCYYRIDAEDPGSLTELDGLVKWDRVLFIIEGKAGAPSDTAERGADSRALRDRLKRTVIAAGKQAYRAMASLDEAGKLVLRDSSGEQISEIVRGEVDEILLLTPTLYRFSSSELRVEQVNELAEWRGKRAPISLFINDLRVISELTTNPAEFIHYFRWRQSLPLGSDVVAADEMDLFSAYLHRLQIPRRLRLEKDSVAILTGISTPIDDYYYWEAGLGPRIKRPTMAHSRVTKEFVVRMCNDRPEGWLDAAGVCLELANAELAGFSKFVLQIATFASRGAVESLRVILPSEGLDFRPERFPSLALISIPRKVDWQEVWRQAHDEFTDVERVLFVSVSSRNRPKIVWALEQRIMN